MRNYARTCWQLPALASDHSSELCHRFVPDPTPAPTPQSSPAATLEMALSAFRNITWSAGTTLQGTRMLLGFLCFEAVTLWPQAGQQDMGGLTSCQLPGEPLSPTGAS